MRVSSNMKRSFEEYCATTSIHGVQYLGERNLPRGERFCWIFLLTIGFLVSASLISNEYYKWKNSQVIITYNNTFTPVWEIPFPTVTICTENKYQKNFTDIFMKNETEIMDDENMSEIVEAAMIMNKAWDVKSILKFRRNSFLDTMKKVAPPLSSVIQECVWRGHGLKSCSINTAFKTTFTDVGLCFTFNSLNPNEIYSSKVQQYDSNAKFDESNWTLDNGYYSSNISDSYPYRAGGSLEVFLLGSKHVIDDWTRNPYQGFVVLLNNPAEVPQSTDNFISIPPNSDVVVSIKPVMITANNNLRKRYLPEQRHCFYPMERPLAFFKTYVQKNCKIECLANFTLQLCDCVEYFAPRKPETKICGSASNDCSRIARELLEEESIKNDIGNLCNCLPDCNHLQYNFELNEASSDWVGLLKVLNPDYKMNGEYLSSVKISFYTDRFIAKYRTETYVFTDFLANCGGLLGLFSGFSIVSFFEIVYHIFLRYWRNTNIEKTKRNAADNVFHLA